MCVCVVLLTTSCDPAEVPVPERAVRFGGQPSGVSPVATAPEERDLTDWSTLSVNPRRSPLREETQVGDNRVSRTEAAARPSDPAPVRAALGDINDCMQPQESGDLTLRVSVRVSELGVPTFATVEGAPTADARRCLERKLLAARYGDLRGEVALDVPLHAEVHTEEVVTRRTVHTLFGNGFPLAEGESYAEE